MSGRCSNCHAECAWGSDNELVVLAEKKLDKVRQFALNLSNNNDRGWLSNVGDDLLELLEEKHD